jgi:tetratricopeptide (TPR) repeat protein
LSASATATAIEPHVVSGPPSRLFVSREKRSTVLCLALILLTLAFYNRVTHNGFVNLDDKGYVTNNDHVLQGLTWKNVKWAFTTGENANWHPLTWLSHETDVQLFKLNPIGHHYVSVLIHSGNAVILFLLLEAVTGLTWPSFMVAALFAIHPMNVESVAWVSERKNVLSMMFFLLTLHAYGWYVRRTCLKRYAVVAGLFALGLMAKPEVITLPFVLLLWDYWPLRRMFAEPASAASQFATPGGNLAEEAPAPRSFSFLVREKIPLFILSAASGVVTFFVQRAGDAVRVAPLHLRLGNAVVAYVRYIGKTFWPTRMVALYPHPGRFLPVWQMVASGALLLAITALVLRLRNRRYLAMGWFWFLGMMVPVIGVVQVGVQAMADRYAYWPYIGLFIAVVWTITEIARERKIPVLWLVVPALAILLGLGAVTYRQIGYWHDSEILWRHTLAFTERNYSAHNALAYALAEQGRKNEAVVEFKEAENLHAYSAHDMCWIGTWEEDHGLVQEAIQQYGRALDVATDSLGRAEVLGHLGAAFAQTGDLVRADQSFAYALRENPNDDVALMGAGLLAEREGNLSIAVERITRAMQVGATDVGYLMLADALRRDGRTKDADDAVAHARSISSDFPKAQQYAAKILVTSGIATN